MAIKKTTEWFVARAKQVHGEKYSYSKSVYTGSTSPITVTCPIHGDFVTIPNSHLSARVGCLKCNGYERWTNETVDERLQGRNIIRLNDFTKHSKGSLPWKCSSCGNVWHAPTVCLMRGSRGGKFKSTGCPVCATNHNSEKRRLSGDEIDERIIERELNVVRLEDSPNMNTKIKWKCVRCDNEWTATPSKVINQGTGCPRCNSRNYSKMAIRWLNTIASKENITIRHYLNDGEFIIPSTKYRVDGYCKETNTVYEFYGDFYHGNPQVFSGDYLCHPYNKDKTAQELYDTTMKREQIIRSLGYRVVTMWESDYIKTLKRNQQT